MINVTELLDNTMAFHSLFKNKNGHSNLKRCSFTENKKGIHLLFLKCDVQHSYDGTKYTLSEVPDPGTGI